jgi:hypothetical protein
LANLGISRDSDGFLESGSLRFLTSGAEAHPLIDNNAGVVYKLFYLQKGGGLGKRVALMRNAEGEYELNYLVATALETVSKLVLLHDCGANPTEIVGLSTSGDFLIVKQPLAYEQAYSRGSKSYPTQDLFEQDRKRAISAIKGVPCVGSGMRKMVAVIAWEGRAWFVADLHERNVMRSFEGQPTIIDALVGPVPSSAYGDLPHLARAAQRAIHWRDHGTLPEDTGYFDCDDAEL